MVLHLRRRASGAIVVVASAAAILFGLAGCTPAEPAPTGIQSPSASASASPGTEWGAYGSKDDACSAVAGDVLTLALVPKNLALADPGSGVDDIDDTIREAADAAPPAIAPNYLQLSAIVAAYGRELTEWRDAVEATATATPTATATATTAATSAAPTASPARSTVPTPTGPAADPPERPAFVDTGYNLQLDRIKAWLSDTCG